MRKAAYLHPDHPEGIYHYDYPLINGIRQYVQIRGQDRQNPVLLFLHGGPGGSVAGVSHIHHAGWEAHFTLVNWDQRNSGKTYLANRAQAKALADIGTMEDFVQDIDGVIAYLHTVLEFDRLILMGFSWGSAIGAEYAKRHPEQLHCFIGVGQHVCYREAILLTCEKMLGMVPADSKDAGKLRAIIETFPEKPSWNRELMYCMRHYMPLSLRLIARHVRRVAPTEILRSPMMNAREKFHAMLPDYSLHRRAYATMLEYDLRQNLHFEVPVLFVFGQEETVCPAELLEKCFSEVAAPAKKIAVVSDASHSCYFDQPEAFMKELNAFLQTL